MRDVPFVRPLVVRLLLRRSSMEADWNARARLDPFFYIRTDAAQPEAFERSGRRDIEEWLLPGLSLPAHPVAVEIGCGIGRISRELAPSLARLYAVDVSAEMIERAEVYCRGQKNIEFFRVATGLPDIASSCADLVFSRLVFQHLPRRAYVRRYLREAFRVLKPGGVIRADADGRTRQWFRRVLADSWSGVVLSERGVRRDLERAGFIAVRVTGAGTRQMCFTGRKPEQM